MLVPQWLSNEHILNPLGGFIWLWSQWTQNVRHSVLLPLLLLPLFHPPPVWAGSWQLLHVPFCRCISVLFCQDGTPNTEKFTVPQFPDTLSLLEHELPSSLACPYRHGSLCVTTSPEVLSSTSSHVTNTEGFRVPCVQASRPLGPCWPEILCTPKL